MTLSPLPRTCRTVVGTGRVFWRPVEWVAAPALFRRASLPEGRREEPAARPNRWSRPRQQRFENCPRNWPASAACSRFLSTFRIALACVFREYKAPDRCRRRDCIVVVGPKRIFSCGCALRITTRFWQYCELGDIRLHICTNSRRMVTALRRSNRTRCNFRERVRKKTFRRNRFELVSV